MYEKHGAENKSSGEHMSLPTVNTAEQSARQDSVARQSVIAEIRTRFAQFADSGMPKYLQLRRAILASIEDDILAPGDQIPPEEKLTSVLGISHGTVRRALGHLAAGGFVTREHGRGTFIAKHQRAIDDSWHYRFLATDGKSLLPVYSHVIDRCLIHAAGPWSRALGADPNGYVRIQRSFDVDRRFLSYSEFFLGAGRFGGMMDLPLSGLENVNLKRVLSQKFGAPTVYVEQRVRVEKFSDNICEIMSMDGVTNGLFLEIVAHTFDSTPISSHMIYVPPTEHMLDLSAHDLATQKAAKVSQP